MGTGHFVQEFGHRVAEALSVNLRLGKVIARCRDLCLATKKAVAKARVNLKFSGCIGYLGQLYPGSHGRLIQTITRPLHLAVGGHNSLPHTEHLISYRVLQESV